MNGLQLRPARHGDLPQIAALGLAVNLQHHAEWPQLFRGADAAPAQLRYWQQCLDANRALCLVAEQDGQFAGMLIAQLVDELGGALLHSRRLCRVATVAVEEGMRRRGIASALMRRAMQHAAAAGVQELRLNAWEFNAAAIALYAKLGLVPRQRTLAIELAPSAAPPEQ